MNDIIPESEQLRVRSLLQNLESELESVDIQILCIQEYHGILLLQDKRAGYIERMEKLRPAIGSHKHHPPEILVEIFLQHAAGIAEQVIYGTGSIHRCLSQFPWVPGHICSR